MTSRFNSVVLAVGIGVLCLSCMPDIGEDEPVPVVVATLDPVTGVLPLPNDLLLDQTTGLVAVPDLPGDDAMTLAIKQDLRRLDGWSAYGPVSAPFDGPLDPSSICLGVLDPRAMEDMVRTPANCDPVTVYMVNIAGFDKLANVQWIYENRTSEGETTGHLTFIPVEPYRAQNTYLVVMTDGLRGTNGERVVPSQVIYFSKLKTPLVDENGNILNTLLLPQTGQTYEAALANAQTLETLRKAFSVAYIVMEGMGVSRDHVVHIWPFTVQSTVEPLMALRDTLSAGNGTDCPAVPTTATLSCPPPDLAYLPNLCGTDPLIPADVYFADQPDIAHDHIAAVTFGTFTSANYIDPDTGRLAFDEEGGLSCSHEEIWFTLALPENPPVTPYPVVIMQHGLMRSRQDLLRVADAFAVEGYATIGIDAVFHGSRSTNLGDNFENRSLTESSTPTAGSDGIPDCSGAGIIMAGPPDESEDLLGCYEDYPFSLAGSRDNFRQSVADMFQLVRVMQAEDGLVELEGVDIDSSDISLFGQSLGTLLSVPFLALEPAVETAVLSAGGGGFATIIDGTESPGLAQLWNGLLEDQGIQRGTLAYQELLSTLQWMMDPADPINYARFLIREPLNEQAPKRILFLWANEDEVIPVGAMEALLRVMGLDRNDPEDIKIYGSTEAPVDHSFIITPDERNPDATRMAREDAANFIAADSE